MHVSTDTMTRGTIGRHLESDRLRHRADRLRRCVDALERRAAELRSDGRAVPAPLGVAIAGFHEDLHSIRQRLASLSR